MKEESWEEGFSSARLEYVVIPKKGDDDTANLYNEFLKWRKSTYNLNAPKYQDVITKRCVPFRAKKDKFYFYSVKRKDGQKVVGLLALMHGWPEAGSLFIAMFYLSQNKHGRGFGSEIIDTLQKNAKEHYYENMMIRVHRVDIYEPTFFYKHGFASLKEIENDDRILVKYL
jgi:ribosomal protein S18 acetylase RimI-like enzyme